MHLPEPVGWSKGILFDHPIYFSNRETGTIILNPRRLC
jgi:hypothetical protein